jgi:hypothetical protein
MAALDDQSPNNAKIAKDLAWLEAELAKLEQDGHSESDSAQPEQAAR